MAEERPPSSLKKPPKPKSVKPEKPSSLCGIKGRELTSPVPSGLAAQLPPSQAAIGGFGLREYIAPAISRRASRLSLLSLSDTEADQQSTRSSSSRSTDRIGDQGIQMMYLDLPERPQTALDLPTELLASLGVYERDEPYIPLTVISVMSLSTVMVYTHWPEKSPPRSISVPPEIVTSQHPKQPKSKKAEGVSSLSHPPRPKSQIIYRSTGKSRGVPVALSHLKPQPKSGPIYQHTAKTDSGSKKHEGAHQGRGKLIERRRTRTISIYPYGVAKQVEKELHQSQSEYLQVTRLRKEKSPSPPVEVSYQIVLIFEKYGYIIVSPFTGH